MWRSSIAHPNNEPVSQEYERTERSSLCAGCTVTISQPTFYGVGEKPPIPFTAVLPLSAWQVSGKILQSYSRVAGTASYHQIASARICSQTELELRLAPSRAS